MYQHYCGDEQMQSYEVQGESRVRENLTHGLVCEVKRNKCKFFRNKHLGGFTLIELLIVLSILGVLIALAVPRFADVASDKEIKICQGNLRTMDSAVAVYRIEQSAWPDPQDITLIKTAGYLRVIPACPGGGSYTLHEDKDRTGCNVSDHILPAGQE